MRMPPQDASQFFEIMMSMLHWVNEAKGVKIEYADEYISSREANALLRIVWEHPEYIDEYLAERGDVLSQKARRTLSKWRKYFVQGPFLIERFTNTGTIFISVRAGQVYLVSGITSDIEDGLDEHTLPCVVETTLIPYKGRIIYDSTMQIIPEILNSEGKQELARVYESVKKQNRIIKTLPPKNPAEINEQWELMIQKIMPTLFEEKETISQEEAIQQISSDPEVNLISQANLAVLGKLLNKTHRSQKDWDRIQDILFSSDIFTAEPMTENGSIWGIDHVLCNEGVLHVFTTFEECQNYIKHLSDNDSTQRYFQIATLPYEAAVEIADENRMKLFLDVQIKNPWKKFLVYDSETRRLSANIAL